MQVSPSLLELVPSGQVVSFHLTPSTDVPDRLASPELGVAWEMRGSGPLRV